MSGADRRVFAEPGRRPAVVVARPVPAPVRTAARTDDALEREADTIAAHVLWGPAGRVPVPISPAPAVRSAAAAPQFASGHDAGAGQPLPDATRRFFASALGHEFSRVRVHADGRAAASARAAGATAFAVGGDIVFGQGEYAPDTARGRYLLAHELVHVVQQGGATGAFSAVAGAGATMQRKVILRGGELDSAARRAFLARYRWANARQARAIVEDMADADDRFDFEDEAELRTEILKRAATTRIMQETQRATAGDAKAFGYPFTSPSALYGPRVNYAARDYWLPRLADDYAPRTDARRNRALLALPRRERYTVYGDLGGSYRWTLSPGGRADPHAAVLTLFTPQPARKRTLLHCDYLVSLVHLRSLAEAVGRAEFNRRVAVFGFDRFILRWNTFADLHLTTLFRSPLGSMIVPGLRSLQGRRPSRENDLVIGDHVVFFNHITYDLINERVGNAWRLENAVLVRKTSGTGDIFLGHGSGEKTAAQMHEKLAQEYNVVADKALALTRRAESRTPRQRSNALARIASEFPRLLRVGNEWRIKGRTRLLCSRDVEVKLKRLRPADVPGLRNPCDPAQMYPVERPIESAPGRVP